jgi:hypothetical protein
VASINGLADQWHFITVVFVNTNIAQDQLWIDGTQQTLQQSGQQTGPPTPVSSSAYIGSYGGAHYGGDPDHSFDGALNNVAFFNQQLLPAQIQAEYAASINGKLNSTILSLGPVAYYPLNETSGSIAHDASGNGNDGTINTRDVTLGIPGGPSGNLRAGVALTGGASGNTIGGSANGTRNVISGNGTYGVQITDSGTSANQVENNFIGLASNGATPVSNTNSGVFVSNGATGNVIGDATGGTRNIISGNRTNGVEITGSGTLDNQVVSNIIGLDATGELAVGNRIDGVAVDSGASGNTIGGLTSTPGTGAGNVISGNNALDGIELTGTGSDTSDSNVIGICTANVVEGNILGLDASGTRRLDANGNSFGNYDGVEVLSGTTNNTIGGITSGAGNVISNNGSASENGDGVVLFGTYNLVASNLIGTDITGTLALGNENLPAVRLGGSFNTVGGTTASARNVISGNVSNYGAVSDFATGGATDDVIEGNYIGTDATGDLALPNSGAGVSLAGSGNTIGGSTPGAGNIIAANGLGMEIAGNYNLVQGNTVGLSANGTRMGNAAFGIGIAGTNNTIGGTSSGTGNIIRNSQQFGLSIDGSGNAVVGDDIEANGSGGVQINYAGKNNTIGGTTSGAGNVISGNGGPGVDLSDNGTTGNIMEGNFIGTDASAATSLGNAGFGVLIENGATNNSIGSTSAGAGNTIAFNTAGVVVQGTSTTANAIRGNAIHDNSAIGIGLGGTTFVANDSQGHAGPNQFQDYPVLQKAVISIGSDLVVSYSVPAADSSATYPLAIDFYLADATGQGKTYLGSDSYSATDLANGVKSVDLGRAAVLGVAVGQSLVATATDAAGNTSEFSPLTSNAVVTLSPFILVLNSTASGALSLTGNASINIPSTLVVDSNAKAALSVSGNAAVEAGSIHIVGGFSTTGNATLNPTPSAGAASVPDPLATLTGPGTAGLTNYGSVTLAGSKSLTISPGIYSSISVSGSATLTLSAGLYLIEGGGFTVTGNASVTGAGVTIYNTGSNYPNSGGNFGGITLSGSGSFSLAAPTSGPYAGIVLFQAHANTRALSLSGNATAGVTGTIYAPSAQLIVSGNAQLHGALDVNELSLAGNGVSTQVADGATGSSIDSASSGTLLAGNLEVYVEDPNGYFTANELARIQDAINAWDNLLAPYNVVITEVSDATLANVVIDTGTTSAAGSAADGVLGSYSSTGEITILQGWNWYDGADPSQICSGQYDFQTVVAHELGHALGLGGSDDASSPMNEVLAPGVVRRTPGTADLNIPEAPEGADPERAAGLPGSAQNFVAVAVVAHRDTPPEFRPLANLFARSSPAFVVTCMTANATTAIHLEAHPVIPMEATYLGSAWTDSHTSGLNLLDGADQQELPTGLFTLAHETQWPSALLAARMRDCLFAGNVPTALPSQIARTLSHLPVVGRTDQSGSEATGAWLASLILLGSQMYSERTDRRRLATETKA